MTVRTVITSPKRAISGTEILIVGCQSGGRASPLAAVAQAPKVTLTRAEVRQWSPARLSNTATTSYAPFRRMRVLNHGTPPRGVKCSVQMPGRGLLLP